MKKTSVFRVNLTGIDGEGDFSCPGCGIKISPEDETETVYTIRDVKMKEYCLEELVLTCNSCGSEIHVLGFNSEDENTDQQFPL